MIRKSKPKNKNVELLKQFLKNKEKNEYTDRKANK